MLDLLPKDSVDPRDRFCLMLLERLDDLSDKYFHLEKEYKKLQEKVKIFNVPKNVISFDPIISYKIHIIIKIYNQESANQHDIALEIAKQIFKLNDTGKSHTLIVSKIKSDYNFNFEIEYYGQPVNILGFLHKLTFPNFKNYTIENDIDQKPRYYKRTHDHTWTFVGTCDEIISENSRMTIG